MNLTISTPPRPTGDATEDTVKLYNWCRTLYTQLKRLIYALDDENIVSVSADKLKSDCVALTADSFTLTNPDGTQYIRCADGKLEICADIITSDEVTDE